MTTPERRRELAAKHERGDEAESDPEFDHQAQCEAAAAGHHHYPSHPSAAAAHGLGAHAAHATKRSKTGKHGDTKGAGGARPRQPEGFSSVCCTDFLHIKPETREFGMSGPLGLAVVKETRWTRKPKLTVGFIDNPAPEIDLQRKILEYMNEWSKFTSAKFMLEARLPMTAQVRITLDPQQWDVEGGYWSYLGTTILASFLKGAPTMCLEGFSLETPDSEFMRVVCHETGHTLGFPHEHMRKEIISLLDRQKTIDYFWRIYGWPERDVIQQVLTPLNPRTLEATRRADEQSIMCYDLPGACTKSGKPIAGGTTIDLIDQHFAASIYPPETPL